MKNLIAVFCCFFVLSCNNIVQDKKQVIEKVKMDTMIVKTSPKLPELIKKPTIIYDTLGISPDPDADSGTKHEDNKKELKFYKKFLQHKINEKKIIKGADYKEEIKYLGILKDLNDKDSYHIITDFSILGTESMLSPRGCSKVICINKKQNKIMIYTLDMPDELPVHIKNNILWFKHEKTKIGVSISGGLPSDLCVSEIGCF